MSGSNQARPDRQGQVSFSAFMDAETHKAFKILAVEEGTTSVALLHELIADTLVRRGKPVPDTTIEYLKDHHRPLPTLPQPPKPTPPKRKAKGHHHG